MYHLTGQLLKPLERQRLDGKVRTPIRTRVEPESLLGRRQVHALNVAEPDCAIFPKRSRFPYCLLRDSNLGLKPYPMATRSPTAMRAKST